MLTSTTLQLFVRAWRDIDAGVLATANIQGKGDLATQAQQEIERLRRALNVCGGAPPSEIIGCFNQASRAFYLNGRADMANELLRGALAVCRAGWQRSGDLTWWGCMLGPYTFQARLAALCGRPDEAMHHYRALYAFLTGGRELTIEDTTLTPATLEWLTANSGDFRGVRAGAPSVYLIEASKGLLLQRKFAELLDFIAQASAEAGLAGASKRHELAVAEIRARALTGLGRFDDAMEQYERIRELVPAGKTAFLTVFAHAARTAAKSRGRQAALDWLNYAEARLGQCPDGFEFLVPRHCVLFAMGFERYALEDFDGAYRCAGEALRIGVRTQRTVGVMRARTLLHMAAASGEVTTLIEGAWHSGEACLQDVRACLHGFERCAALLHLALAEDSAAPSDPGAVALIREAQVTLNWIERHGFVVPPGFRVPLPGGFVTTDSDACGLDDPNLQELYDVYLDYAQQNGTAPVATPAYSGA